MFKTLAVLLLVCLVGCGGGDPEPAPPAEEEGQKDPPPKPDICGPDRHWCL
jgi:hypothetical protein